MITLRKQGELAWEMVRVQPYKLSFGRYGDGNHRMLGEPMKGFDVLVADINARGEKIAGDKIGIVRIGNGKYYVVCGKRVGEGKVDENSILLLGEAKCIMGKFLSVVQFSLKIKGFGKATELDFDNFSEPTDDNKNYAKLEALARLAEEGITIEILGKGIVPLTVGSVFEVGFIAYKKSEKDLQITGNVLIEPLRQKIRGTS